MIQGLSSHPFKNFQPISISLSLVVNWYGPYRVGHRE